MRFIKSLLEILNSKNKIFKIMLLVNIIYILFLLYDKYSFGLIVDRCIIVFLCIGDFVIW